MSGDVSLSGTEFNKLTVYMDRVTDQGPSEVAAYLVWPGQTNTRLVL